MIVQDLFKSMNDEKDKKSISDYIFDSYEPITPKPNDTRSKEELRAAWNKHFEDGWNAMLELAPVVDNSIVCIVHPYLFPLNNATTYDVSAIEIDDFLKKYEKQDNVTTLEELYERDRYISFSFIYEERAKVLGYQFAEPSLTMYPIEEVVGALFFEMTWNGFTNEEVEEVRQRVMDFDNGMIEEDDYYDDEEEENDFEDIEEDITEEEFDEWSRRYDEDENRLAIINFNCMNQYYDKIYEWLTIKKKEELI